MRLVADFAEAQHGVVAHVGNGAARYVVEDDRQIHRFGDLAEVLGTAIGLNLLFNVPLLYGVIITGFFIPNMLRKGTLDLLLVKPISRWTLLLYKYVGGLSFIFLNAAVAVIGIWRSLA